MRAVGKFCKYSLIKTYFHPSSFCHFVKKEETCCGIWIFMDKNPTRLVNERISIRTNKRRKPFFSFMRTWFRKRRMWTWILNEKDKKWIRRYDTKSILLSSIKVTMHTHRTFCNRSEGINEIFFSSKKKTLVLTNERIAFITW